MTPRTRCLLLAVALLALGLLLIEPVAAADLYKYRDPQTGRLVLTNKPPPPDAVIESRTEARPPREAAAPPVVVPQPPPAAPLVVRPLPAAPSAPAPQAKAVDTTQLALIRGGMTMYEVEQRLGKPEAVYDRGKVWVRGQFLQAIDWVYPAPHRGVPPALIRFVGSEVAFTDRLR